MTTMIQMWRSQTFFEQENEDEVKYFFEEDSKGQNLQPKKKEK